MEKIEECMDNYTMVCKFRSISNQFEWTFANVYGPNSDVDCRLLWEELVGLISWYLPWWIEGDFNMTRFPSE